MVFMVKQNALRIPDLFPDPASDPAVLGCGRHKQLYAFGLESTVDTALKHHH